VAVRIYLKMPKCRILNKRFFKDLTKHPPGMLFF
jgi:hypothetical protein